MILKVLRWIPIFSPSNSFRLIWDIMMLISLLYLLYVNLVIFAFGIRMEEIEYGSFMWLCNSFLFLDILIGLNTGIYQNGLISYERKAILRNYLNDNIISDMVGNTIIVLHFALNSKEPDSSVYLPI